MASEEKVKYLGDIFSEKGDNVALVEDRVGKGMRCIVSSIAMCDDISMGVSYTNTSPTLQDSFPTCSSFQQWSMEQPDKERFVKSENNTIKVSKTYASCSKFSFKPTGFPGTRSSSN